MESRHKKGRPGWEPHHHSAATPGSAPAVTRLQGQPLPLRTLPPAWTKAGDVAGTGGGLPQSGGPGSLPAIHPPPGPFYKRPTQGTGQRSPAGGCPSLAGSGEQASLGETAVGAGQAQQSSPPSPSPRCILLSDSPSGAGPLQSSPQPWQARVHAAAQLHPLTLASPHRRVPPAPRPQPSACRLGNGSMKTVAPA